METPDSPAPAHTAFHYRLSAERPRLETAGGSHTSANPINFPALAGHDASISILRLVPGALREPHWHPAAWELNYVISGTVQVTVIPSSGSVDVSTLHAGDIAFVPQGFGHSIANVGDTEAVLSVVFNSGNPGDICLTGLYKGLPSGQFEQSLKLPDDSLATAARTGPPNAVPTI